MKCCLLVQGGDSYDLAAQLKSYPVNTPIRLQADDLKVAVLEEALFCPSFFAESLVVIEKAESLDDKALKLVVDFAKKPTPRVWLVLHATGSCDLSQYMSVVTIAEVKPWDKQGATAEWIQGYVKAENCKISPQVAMSIAATGSSDRFYLTQELDKLICYVGDKKEITTQDIKEISCFEQENTVWQLTEAFLQRDKPKSMQVLTQLLDQQVSAFLIIRALRNACHQALMMLSLHDVNPAKVQENFPQLRGKLFEKNFRMAQEAGSSYLTKSLLLIDKTELKLKDAPFDETTLLMKVFV